MKTLWRAWISGQERPRHDRYEKPNYVATTLRSSFIFPIQRIFQAFDLVGRSSGVSVFFSPLNLLPFSALSSYACKWSVREKERVKYFTRPAPPCGSVGYHVVIEGVLALIACRCSMVF